MIIHKDVDEICEDLFFMAGSSVMRKLRTQAELLANVNVPVLIIGESGTGKEIVGKCIHKLSIRSGYQFLKVNCALPSDVLESELFGSDGAAIAGGMQARPGKFELCQNGTILLDEISEMPSALQAKLLHVLQHKQFFRLGGDTTINVDVRILAATNRNVEQALLAKKLREDLYYRLSAFIVQVPPLRDRKEEIPFLLRHFMQQIAKHYGLSPRPVTATLLEACQTYSWPGNLHELENVAKRYLVMGDEFIDLRELGPKLSTQGEESAWSHSSGEESHDSHWNGYAHEGAASLKSMLRSVKGEAEKSAITTALEKTDWNRRAAARDLGISYRSLLYKIQEYQLAPQGGHKRFF